VASWFDGEGEVASCFLLGRPESSRFPRTTSKTGGRGGGLRAGDRVVKDPVKMAAGAGTRTGEGGGAE
jgi:hypothetical protein